MGITVLKNNVPWGPFTRAQIQEGLQRGDFSPLTLAHGTGMKDWQPLGEVLKQTESILPSNLPPVPSSRSFPPVPGSTSASAMTTARPPVPGSPAALALLKKATEEASPPPPPPTDSIQSTAPSAPAASLPPNLPTPPLPSSIGKTPPPLTRSVSLPNPATADVPTIQPARIFPRFIAFLIDVMVLFVPVLLLFGLGALTLGVQGMAEHSDAETMQEEWDLLWRNFRELLLLVAIGGAWLYAALLECSRWQATVGKQWAGLKVVGERGERLSFFRTTGRHVAKFISALPLFLGFALALFDPNGRAFHDRLSGTRVVPK